MDYNILRENDIRGIYPSQINEEVVERISKAFAVYLTEKNTDTCVVGHDNRLSGESLHKHVIDALIDSGINVIDIGLVTTSMLNYACIKKEVPYAIMITASHNKSEDNGLKLFGENYLHLSQEELSHLYGLVKDESSEMGHGELTKTNIKEDYIEMMTNKFKKINKRVVVDCGNGTASIVVKDILSKIFTDVTYINCESDGSFPVHNPDPNVEENLRWLKKFVLLRHADYGLAVDGDCDRVGIVDEQGNMISTDYLIGIFANDIIPKNQNKKVIIDVKCSCSLDHEIKKIGGSPIMVKNGSAYIETVIHDTPALIGGEYSGHIFFKDHHYGYDDGLYGGLRFGELLDKLNIKSSDLIKNMEKYENTPEIRLEVDDNEKKNIVQKVKDYCIQKNYNCNFEDGVRVNYEDGFALIRSSNTGPYLTLRFEAKTKDVLNDRKEEFMSLINPYIK